MEYKESWANGKSAQVVHVVRWRPSRAQLRYLPASRWSARSLRASQFLQKSGALATFNGGYFDAANQPLGLLFAGTWVQKQAATGSAFGGMFTLIGDKPALHPIFQLSDAEYDSLRQAPNLRLLIQCGPRLLAGGKRVEGLEKDTFTRRTGLGADAQGRLLLFATSLGYLPSFAQYQEYLQKQLGLVDALNLDGGSSTQCSVRHTVDNPGFSPVPFALGLFSEKT